MDAQDEFGLPVWPAAERNKQPILEQLEQLIFDGHGTILEVAAGTGQHALHFAPRFPGYDYYVSDCDPDHLATLRLRLRASQVKNLMGPLFLDTTQSTWPLEKAQVIYCANMAHIAPFEATVGLLRGAAHILSAEGLLLIYGPFKVDGRHISESNEAFDTSLRERDRAWGVRDVNELSEAARIFGLRLAERRPLPANNCLLVFTRN
jgi:SAM-dependent methyltransferase